MYQSKLFTLLRGIDPSELRWLHKFLKSPFYNTNQQYLQLFEYIKKYHPDLESPKLTKEAAHKKLFPKEKFNVQRMRKMMHELTVLVEDFMVAQHFHNDQKARKKVLTEELGRRNIYALFEKGIEEQREALEAQPYRNEAYFLEQFELMQNYFAHPMTTKEKGSAEENLAIVANLEIFYFFQKLEAMCNLESVKGIYSVERQEPFFEKIILEIYRRKLDNIPLVKLYLLVYQLFKHRENESLYDNLYQEFLSNKAKLDVLNRERILKFLINYGTYKLNRGNSKFVKKNYELYKIGLDENLLNKNGIITIITFGGIVTCASYLGENEWARNFIEANKIYIEKEKRSEVVAFNLASILFREGQYEKTVNLLSQLNFNLVLYKFIVKTLQLKCYFELLLKDESYYELITSQIETFDRFVRRADDLSQERKDLYQNFGRWLKKIVDAFWKKNTSNNFERELEAFFPVSNKPWLLEKIKSIRGENKLSPY